jgi:hypothetical protein
VIFGWLEHGRTDRWILVDAVFPWPSLHNGRNAIRAWADAQQKARVLKRSAGPRRCPWPCKTAVKEDGDVELRIWPCEVFGKPRSWGPHDRVWRPAIKKLAEHVAADIGCPVHVLWIGGSGDGEIERAVSPPGLRGRGFQCWGKGEREPKGEPQPLTPDKIARMKITTADLGIMPQGEDAWH